MSDNIILKEIYDDIKIFEFKRFADDRGFFSEIYIKDIIKNDLENFEISQINYSMSKKNVARGLHLQINPPMGKMMRLIKGRAIFFAFDCRRKNHKKRDIFQIELNEKSNLFVWAPFYFARGFISLESDTLVEYLCTGRYNQDGEYVINMFDQSLNHSYKRDSFDISQKDESAMSIDKWFSLNIDL